MTSTSSPRIIGIAAGGVYEMPPGRHTTVHAARAVRRMRRQIAAGTPLPLVAARHGIPARIAARLIGALERQEAS